MSGIFPDARTATVEGLVAVGGPLSVEALTEAYGKGIFPWPQEGYPMLWFSPDPRGVLDFSDVHVPRSLAKFQRQNPQFRFTENEAFNEVIQNCREQPRPGQTSTWITPQIVASYRRLFAKGQVLTVECWEGQELIGGVYGVLSERYFSAESMFHKRDNASKLCLLHLAEKLRQRGFSWMDVQMVTPVVEALGGKYISRDEFLRRIGV